jgi:alkanesulfonate monooxygenase SsuD/methylene tetrahydromethanopterin reductase-like flavin-dependent oxidoreductase (luciferase family)
LTVLSWVAAATTRIGLGVAVLVLPTYHPIHVAHQIATLDQLSGGRVRLGVGLGRQDEYAAFQIPTDRTVRRFTESIEVIRALWEPGPVTFRGDIFPLDGVTIGTRPSRQLPIWFGGAHPAAIRRAARLADGWIGGGGSSNASFIAAVPQLRAELERVGRDPTTYPISKRVFVAVHEHANEARVELTRWFSEVYRRPDAVEDAGVFGTPEQVGEQLRALVTAGATHLLLNPVDRLVQHVDVLAELASR